MCRLAIEPDYLRDNCFSVEPLNLKGTLSRSAHVRANSYYHLITNLARQGLTSVIGREPVFSLRMSTRDSVPLSSSHHIVIVA